MSTETETRSDRTRGVFDRLRASPFLSELLSNRLALAGLVIIVVMVVVAVYARLFIDLQAISLTQFGQNPPRQAPGWWANLFGDATTVGLLDYPFGTDGQARDIFPRVLYGAWYAMLYGTITVGVSTVIVP